MFLDKMGVETIILQTLEASSGTMTQKEVIKSVKKKLSDGGAFEKKAVKKILKQLVKSGTIALAAGEKKVYCQLFSSKSKTTTNSRKNQTEDDSDSSRDDNDNCDGPVPFAEALRRRKKDTKSISSRTLMAEPKKADKEEEVVDIDEEIRRLEAELEADNSASDSEDDDDMSSTASDAPQEKAGVISLSTLATDRIAALPEAHLPSNKRRTLKGIDKATASSEEPKAKRRKKASSAETTGNNISDGLRAAVKQVLDGYTPRSNEKILFYCRVSAKQYKDGDEFFEHKKGDFHKAAVELEKKASYCKLCRKQLTSPVQLKEHLHSKPHKDRLQLLRSRQPPRKR